MARSLSNNIKLVSSFAETFSLAINRRGFAAAVGTQSGGAVSSVEKMIMKKKTGVKGGEESWVPDPKTGYYRPENRGEEIDVAELREILLKRNN